MDIYSFKFLEAINPKGKVVSEVMLLLKTQGKIFPYLFCFCWLQESLAYGKLHLLPYSYDLLFYVCFSSSLSTSTWAHLNPGWSHFEIINLITFTKSLFSNKVMCIGSRGTYLFWGGVTIQPTTLIQLFDLLPTICSFKRDLPSFAHLTYFCT